MNDLAPSTQPPQPRLAKSAAYDKALKLPGFVETVNEHAIIAVTDPAGRFIFVNDAFCAISKYSRDELIGQHYGIISSGHHPPVFFEELEAKLHTGTPWRGRIKNRAKDGTYYWVDTLINPIKDEAGNVRHQVSVRSEVTELVVAQEHLERNRQGEAAIRRILAIALSDIPIERMLEGSLEVVSLVSWLAPVSRSAVFLVDPESKQIGLVASRDLGSVEDRISDGTCFGTCICTQAGANRTVTVEACTQVGKQESANDEAKWEHYAIPLVSQGGLLGVLVLTAPVGQAKTVNQDNFFTDVAKALTVAIEQKNVQDGLKAERERGIRKQQELEEKSALMEAGFDNMVEGLVALTPDLTILASNKRFAELMEISPELTAQGRSFEAILEHMRNVVVDRRQGAMMSVEGMRKTVRSGTGKPVKFVFKSGKTIEARANIIPEVGAVFTIADVTEALLTEGRARQSLKLDALGDLAGGVAHEYNNLLTSIQGFARMALRKFSDEDRVRDSLQEIIEATGRASEITQQMLTFSKKQVVAPVVVNIGEAIRDMEPVLRVFVQANLDMRFQVKSTAYASIDPALLTECISNLVRNGRQAMPDGGTITIACETVELTEAFVTSHGDKLEPGRYASIAVTDTGKGMDPDTLSQIFDPFFTTHEVGSGTGLGLSMVFGMAKNQNGAIDVSSEPGQGATFTIYLPEVSVPSDRAEGDARAESGADPRRPSPGQPSPIDLNVVPTEDDAEQLMRFL